jgi:hypothetical protein
MKGDNSGRLEQFEYRYKFEGRGLVFLGEKFAFEIAMK